MAKTEITVNTGNAFIERRHFIYDGTDTTIALDRIFWMIIDGICKWRNISWERWAIQHLNSKPANVGRARWLRNAVVVETVIYRRMWA